MYRFIPFFLFLLIAAGCVIDDKSKIQKRTNNIKDITRYPADAEPEMQINLKQEKRFGSDEDILIGDIGNITVDNQSRVFIEDGKKHTIHVFDSTGSYVTKIGREGAGPGEFRMIGNLSTDGKFLFTYDGLQRRVNVFSLDSLKISHTLNLNRIDIDRIPTLRGYFFPGSVRFMGKGEYLVVFSKPIYANPDDPKYNLNDQFRLYYAMDETGRIKSNRVLKQKDYRALTATVDGGFIHTLFEFLGKPLLAISKEKNLYTARTTDFLIEIRDSAGKYLRAFYYPMEKQPFSREEALRRQKKKYPEVYDHRASVIRNAPDEQIPEHWPVLDDMLIDDQNRLWVSTVTEDPKKLQWWVLDKKGKLLVRFIWPEKRLVETIKNGKLYACITNEGGLDQIVRYDITMR